MIRQPVAIPGRMRLGAELQPRLWGQLGDEKIQPLRDRSTSSTAWHHRSTCRGPLHVGTAFRISVRGYGRPIANWNLAMKLGCCRARAGIQSSAALDVLGGDLQLKIPGRICRPHHTFVGLFLSALYVVASQVHHIDIHPCHAHDTHRAANIGLMFAASSTINLSS